MTTPIHRRQAAIPLLKAKKCPQRRGGTPGYSVRRGRHGLRACPESLFMISMAAGAKAKPVEIMNRPSGQALTVRNGPRVPGGIRTSGHRVSGGRRCLDARAALASFRIPMLFEEQVSRLASLASCLVRAWVRPGAEAAFLGLDPGVLCRRPPPLPISPSSRCLARGRSNQQERP